MTITFFSGQGYADDQSGMGSGDGIYEQAIDPFIFNGTSALGPHNGDGLDDVFALNEDVTGFGNLFLGTITHNGDPFVVVSAEDPFVPGPTTAGDIILLAPPWVTLNSAADYPTTVDLGSLDTSAFTFCFAEGTMIATSEGEVAVEDLTPDHLIATADGRFEPLHWLGKQTHFSLQMIRIAAGALGDGLPRRDLTVTRDHALLLDGMLVNAEALVGGTGITRLPAKTTTVYHVETLAHEVILAEGAQTESFIDYVGRKNFDNYGAYLEAHGADRIIPEMDRPRLTTAAALPETLRARLGMKARTNAA